MLLEDLARKHFTKDRIQKYREWVENANKAKETGSLGSKDNQYDKAEELISFYAFAPLELREDKKQVVQEILGFCGIDEPIEEH